MKVKFKKLREEAVTPSYSKTIESLNE